MTDPQRERADKATALHVQYFKGTRCRSCDDLWPCLTVLLARDLLASLDREAALQKTIDELRWWVDDLQSGMFINCVYCGHRYGPAESTPASMADVLKEHIEQCPKHPMSAMKAKLAAAEKRVEELEQLRANDTESIQNYDRDLISAVERAEQAESALALRDKLYFELLYAVESKWPDETRHQTALRYIRERENRPSDIGVVKQALAETKEGK